MSERWQDELARVIDEHKTMTVARVWVGCLGCYTAGALVGAWVDALEAGEAEPHVIGLGAAGIRAPACGRETADEPWCFDLEGFGPFLTAECSPAEAQRVGELLEAIEADGADVEAVGAWLEWSGTDRPAEWDRPTREAFEDSYAGEWDSGADYAAELAEELGVFAVHPDGFGSSEDISSRWPFGCIDWAAAWRELELGDGYGTAEAGPGRVYVFRP